MSLGTACIDQDTSEYAGCNTIPIEPADVDFLRRRGGWRSVVNTFETAAVADPMVVTDDRISRHMNLATALARNQFHCYFADPISSETESLIAVAKMWLNEDTERQTREIWRTCFNFLVSSPFVASAVGIVDTPSTRRNRPAIWDFITTHAIVDPTRSQQMLRESGRKSLAAEYQAILAGALEPQGYEPQELYEEGLAGFVADFLRGRERLTCVVSSSTVQLLFVQNCTVRSQLFDQSAAGKLEFAEFVEENVR